MFSNLTHAPAFGPLFSLLLNKVTSCSLLMINRLQEATLFTLFIIVFMITLYDVQLYL